MTSLRDPVLVTGASGFVGRHLARALVDRGFSVHGVSRRLQNDEAVPGLRWWQTDLGDRQAVERMVAAVRPRTVFHFAGHTAGRGRADAMAMAESFATNLDGTLALLGVLADAPQGPDRIVCAGGLEEYGNGPVPFVEDQRESPVSAYSASQVAATHAAGTFHVQRSLPVVVLRLGLVFGPGQPSTFLIPALVDACLSGEPFAMTDGSQTRDYVYVADVISAAIAAATAKGAAGQVINVSEGVERRVADVARLVASLAGAPDCLQLGAMPGRPYDVQRMVADTTRARQLLNWHATTPFESGLRKTVDACRHRPVGSLQGGN
jgi:nucleoside-diphosphate-sugar epimerase